jgi:hypothetical protein
MQNHQIASDHLLDQSKISLLESRTFLINFQIVSIYRFFTAFDLAYWLAYYSLNPGKKGITFIPNTGMKYSRNFTYPLVMGHDIRKLS